MAPFPAFHFKLDALPFLESVEVELLKTAAMEEDFPSILGMDEPESPVVDDLLRAYQASNIDRKRPPTLLIRINRLRSLAVSFGSIPIGTPSSGH